MSAPAMKVSSMRVVVATKNRGKLTELRALLEGVRVAGHPLELIGVDQADVSLPDVEETGSTYEANALLKARAIAEKTGLATLADDSGLEVDALDGAPGVHSARYAGDAGPSANTHKLMHVMERIEERTARFRCVIAFLASPSAEPLVVQGVCEGAIAHLARGAGGFGYDPVFDVAATELALLGIREARTMSELSEEQKNVISHRGRAVRALRAVLEAR